MKGKIATEGRERSMKRPGKGGEGDVTAKNSKRGIGERKWKGRRM